MKEEGQKLSEFMRKRESMASLFTIPDPSFRPRYEDSIRGSYLRTSTIMEEEDENDVRPIDTFPLRDDDTTLLEDPNVKVGY
jgi:hypothetical protein